MSPSSAATPRGLAAGAYTALALAVAAYFALTAVVAIYHFGLRFPAFDQYRLYAHYLGLPFPDNVLQPENGHRPIVPALLRVLEIHCCGARQRLQLVVGALLACATAALIAWVAWRDRTRPWWLRAAAVLAASLTVFWLANARMLIHGNESVHTYLVTFAVVACGLLLHGTAPVRVGRQGGVAGWFGIALLGVVAAFSFAPGMALLPAAVMVAVALRAPWRVTAGLAALALACALLYLFALPDEGRVQAPLVLDPAANLRHALAWLASPWMNAWLLHAGGNVGGWMNLAGGGSGLIGVLVAASARMTGIGADTQTIPIAVIVGGIGVLAWGIAFGRTWRRPGDTGALAIVALTMATFALGAAAIVSLGRTAFFTGLPMQLFAERYLPWSCLFWGGLLLYAIDAGARSRWAVAVAAACLAIAVVLYPTHRAWAGWSGAIHREVERSAAAAWLGVDADTLPREGDAAPEHVHATLRLMREGALGFFRDPPFLRPGERLNRPLREPDTPQWRHLDRVVDDPLSGLPVARVQGVVADIAALDPWLAVVDGADRVVGLGRFDWIPGVPHQLRLRPSRMRGYDALIRGYDPAQHYRVVVQAADGTIRVATVLGPRDEAGADVVR